MGRAFRTPTAAWLRCGFVDSVSLSGTFYGDHLVFKYTLSSDGNPQSPPVTIGRVSR
jgi:hypothetical protein